MYLSKENRKKVFLSMLFIALTAASILTGKTFANSIILTAYPTTILPYFYLSLGLSFFISSIITSKYSKHPKKFIIYFKIMYLLLLISVAVAIKWNMTLISFIGSILVLTFSLITGTLPWNYVSEIFIFQEYKQYVNTLLISYTVGGILIGAFIGFLSYVSIDLTPILLLSIIFTAELASIFCILSLSKFIGISIPSQGSSLGSNLSLYKNSLFQYFVLFAMASVIITILVDYNLKLVISATIEKQNIASVINIINFLSTAGILILQLFFIDSILRVLGSKKIIFIYPLILTLMSVLTYINFNFIWIAALFICNELFSTTTYLIARDLYLNILPLALKRVARFKLSGIVKSMATLFSSFVIWKFHFESQTLSISFLIIIICSVFSLYLAKILVGKYIKQLAQSIYLRHFDPELIQREQVDQHDLEYLIEQALNYSDPDAQLYGLQLLNNEKSITLPFAISEILTGKNHLLQKEVSKLLASRRDQRQFEDEAKSIILKVSDEETRWYLALYLVGYGSEDYLFWIEELCNKNNPSSLALLILISLKQGDLELQIRALEILSNMGHSQDNEQQKWFLYILSEFSWLQKENYLIQFINQDVAPLQILAIQRVSSKPSALLLSSLVNHIGEPPISFALNNCFVEIGEEIADYVEKKFYDAPTLQLKTSCINVLYQLNGDKAEQSLTNILSQTDDGLVRMMIAKHLAYRSVKMNISNQLQYYLLDTMKAEGKVYGQLEKQKLHYKDPLIQVEIDAQMQVVKKSILYFVSAYIGSVEVLNSVSLFEAYKSDKSQQSLALELIDSTSENKQISSLLTELFAEKKINTANMEPITIPWLNQYINFIESRNMEPIYTFTRLRKVELFKTLPAETLQILASCCSTKNRVASEVIFNEGDEGDGLYIVDSGEVIISKQGVEINRMKECAYFGELALLSDIPRFATAIAAKESVLFYIDKSDFDRITDENPEIIKNMIKQVIRYLTGNAGV